MKALVFLGLMAIALIVSCDEKSNHARVAKKTGTLGDTTLKWTDYQIGELPPEGYFKAHDSIIKKWKIRYTRIQGGCEATTAERDLYEKDNPKYFKFLEKRFGKDWQQRFNAEVAALDQKFLKDKKAGLAKSVPDEN